MVVDNNAMVVVEAQSIIESAVVMSKTVAMMAGHVTGMVAADVATAMAMVTAVSGEGVACEAGRHDKRAADDENLAKCRHLHRDFLYRLDRPRRERRPVSPPCLPM